MVMLDYPINLSIIDNCYENSFEGKNQKYGVNILLKEDIKKL